MAFSCQMEIRPTFPVFGFKVDSAGESEHQTRWHIINCFPNRLEI